MLNSTTTITNIEIFSVHQPSSYNELEVDADVFFRKTQGKTLRYAHVVTLLILMVITCLFLTKRGNLFGYLKLFRLLYQAVNGLLKILSRNGLLFIYILVVIS